MTRFHIDPDARVEIREIDSTAAEGTPPNVIVIRARMNVEIAGRVRSELAKRNAAMHTQGTSGEAAVALLLHNILAWRGPDFDDLPCTPENICALPPVELDPFIEKVVNEIGERNGKRESPNGRLPAMGSTSGNAGAADSSPLPTHDAARPILLSANGRSRSPLRNTIIGHRSRSEP